MSKVRCAGCDTYGDKDTMVRYGLGWCCDDACRSSATRQRQEKRSPSQGPTSTTRTNVKVRDGHRCRFCGSPNSLTIHHVKYRSEGGPHTASNLITLCVGCHSTVHSNKYRFQPVLLELLRLGYEEQQFLSVLQVEKRITGRSPPD